MKRIKAFTSAILVILVVFCSIYTAFAAVYIEDWGFRFEKINNGSSYEINKYIGDKTAVSIPDKYNGFRITSIGEYAFIETAVTSVDFGNNISEVKNGAFINVTSLTDIVFNDGLTSIGNLAFAGCSGLNELTVPASVTEIADDAFANCKNLTIRCYTDSYAHQYAVTNEIPFVLIDAPAEVTFILGDADGDGEISILDATKIQRVLADFYDADVEMIRVRGNVDEDPDGLNISHATKIQRFLADYTVAEPIGTEVTRELT